MASNWHRYSALHTRFAIWTSPALQPLRIVLLHRHTRQRSASEMSRASPSANSSRDNDIVATTRARTARPVTLSRLRARRRAILGVLDRHGLANPRVSSGQWPGERHERRGPRIDFVDRDADPQSCAASRRLPALESDAKPVAADLAGGPVAGDLLESERLVESETALDVRDSEAECCDCLDHDPSPKRTVLMPSFMSTRGRHRPSGSASRILIGCDEICRRLDRLPWAVELTAVRARPLSPAATRPLIVCWRRRRPTSCTVSPLTS
jgi:hypothetical protein